MEARVVILLYSFASCICTAVLGRAIRPAVDCSQNEIPVCAKCKDELKTFSNPCALRWENENSGTRCFIVSHGDCSENTSDCVEDCTVFPAASFCAQDGHSFMTFTNECQLKKQNRCAKRNYTVVYPGYCK